MPKTCDPWKALLVAECRKKGLSDSSDTSGLEKRLTKHASTIHKRKQLVGRPPCPLKKIAIVALHKLKLGESGDLDMLKKRYREAKATKTVAKSFSSDSFVMKINKTHVSADELQELLNLKVGSKCSFKGKKKVLVECSSGGYRWKSC